MSFMLLQVCVTFVFGALLEYALVNYASRSDAQRLAKKKVQKQWELDHCSFDPAHMEDALSGPAGSAASAANNGGSFAMVSRISNDFALKASYIWCGSRGSESFRRKELSSDADVA